MHHPVVKVYIAVLLVLIFTIGWVYTSLKYTDIHNFILIGKNFVNRSNKSAIINSKAKYAHYDFGYDGQFYYYLALDPINAYHYMDTPAYRYTRIAYPLLARFFSFGKLEIIPYVLLIINIIAITLSTYFLGLWFLKNNLSPYFSLIYGLYPGIHLAIVKDLTEPLAYTFVIIAVFLYHSKIRYKLIFSSLFFSAAIFTREITALFPLVYGASLFIVNRNPKNGLIFSFLTFVPFILYELFLLGWLGLSSVYGYHVLIEFIPFYGILKFFPFGPGQLEQIQTVVIPALITGGLGIYAIKQRYVNPEIIAILLNIIFLIILLPSGSYEGVSGASARINAGTVAAALFCLPAFLRASRQSLLIFLLAVCFWFQGWFFSPL